MDLSGFSKAEESQAGSATRFFFISGVSLLLSCLYILCHGTYNIFFHPLHKYPGPRTWIAFPIFRHIASLRGVLDTDIRHLHEEYGTFVRFSANQLSFITAHAWKDIYGHSHRQLPKFLQANPGKAPDIINSNDADHTGFRKALAHGFSDKALSRQEPLMMIYINLLIEKLRDVAISGHKTDMVQWYNLTAFDIIGDLAFGTPFEGLKNNRLCSWISMIFKAVKLGVFLRTMREYPLIGKPLMFLMAGKSRKFRVGARAHVRETVMGRIDNPKLEGRGDLMDAMQRHKGGSDGLSVDELVANANILIIAGSETTATLLSGVTYLLLKNPRCLRKVTGEVRGAFEKEEEIDFVNASSRLPYMLACLDEALRMYPPVPS